MASYSHYLKIKAIFWGKKQMQTPHLKTDKLWYITFLFFGLDTGYLHTVFLTFFLLVFVCICVYICTYMRKINFSSQNGTLTSSNWHASICVHMHRILTGNSDFCFCFCFVLFCFYSSICRACLHACLYRLHEKKWSEFR